MGANFANVFARVRMPAVVLAHTGWNEEREWEWDWERPGIYLAVWRKAQANGRHVESAWVSSSHLPTPLLRLYRVFAASYRCLYPRNVYRFKSIFYFYHLIFYLGRRNRRTIFIGEIYRWLNKLLFFYFANDKAIKKFAHYICCEIEIEYILMCKCMTIYYDINIFVRYPLENRF